MLATDYIRSLNIPNLYFYTDALTRIKVKIVFEGYSLTYLENNTEQLESYMRRVEEKRILVNKYEDHKNYVKLYNKYCSYLKLKLYQRENKLKRILK